MFTRTAAFDTALKKGHAVVSRVIVTGYTGQSLELPVYEGNVSIADEPIRRRCTLRTRLHLSSYVPSQIGDILSPTSEFRPERGIKYADGTTEYIPLGVFGISDVKMGYDGEELLAEIDGYDRARKLIRARMTNEYPIASGTNVKAGIQALLQARYPSISLSSNWNAFTTTETFNSVVLATNSDPWAFARRVFAEALGRDIFFDNVGALDTQVISDPVSSAPVWTYAEGTEAMILAANRRLNDNEFCNHWVVTGEHPENSAPVRGEAYDNDPNSVTYINGPMGDVPKFFSSEFIKTTAQATTAAQARLSKDIGLPEEVRFTSIPHPAHDVLDPVAITVASLKVSAVYILDKFNIGLGHEQPMNASTRKVNV